MRERNFRVFFLQLTFKKIKFYAQNTQIYFLTAVTLFVITATKDMKSFLKVATITE